MEIENDQLPKSAFLCEQRETAVLVLTSAGAEIPLVRQTQKSPPANWRARIKRKRLEPEGSTEVNAPGPAVGSNKSAVGRRRVTKTSTRSEVAGVLEERVNTGEVLMVEDVQHARAEFKRGPFADFEFLDHSEASDVGNGVRRQVARRIAERRAEYRLRLLGVYDEPDLVLGDRDIRARNGGLGFTT